MDHTVHSKRRTLKLCVCVCVSITSLLSDLGNKELFFQALGQFPMEDKPTTIPLLQYKDLQFAAHRQQASPAKPVLTQMEASVSQDKFWLAKGIVGRPHQPCNQGRVPEPHIPNVFPKPDTRVLPGRGTLGRIGMGPSAAVTHPVISWTFIHFLLNYVLLKMVFCGFLTGSF